MHFYIFQNLWFGLDLFQDETGASQAGRTGTDDEDLDVLFGHFCLRYGYQAFAKVLLEIAERFVFHGDSVRSAIGSATAVGHYNGSTANRFTR